jgi:hypothetical protein
MKQLVTAIFCCVLIACGKPGGKEKPVAGGTDSVVAASDPRIKLNLQISKLEEIDSSGILMFPLAMGETEKRGKSDYYKEVPYNMYWNIIFYNSVNGQSHLLSDTMKLLVNDFGYNNPAQRDKLKSKSKLFFNLTVKDNNEDGLLNGDDPNYLFVTNKQGKNLKQVSPAGCDFFDWYVVENSDLIIMLVRVDSNKDQKFDEEDEKAAYRFDLTVDSIPAEIAEPAFKDKLRNLYHRDWQRKK